MPLFEYRKQSGEVVEVLLKHKDALEEIEIDGEPAVKLLSIPARMAASWAGAAGTWGKSINGTYNRGLGSYVNSYKEMEQIADQKGLVLMDNNKNYFRESVEKANEAKREHEIVKKELESIK
jgi:hypothetical protein